MPKRNHPSDAWLPALQAEELRRPGADRDESRHHARRWRFSGMTIATLFTLRSQGGKALSHPGPDLEGAR